MWKIVKINTVYLGAARDTKLLDALIHDGHEKSDVVKLLMPQYNDFDIFLLFKCNNVLQDKLWNWAESVETNSNSSQQNLHALPWTLVCLVVSRAPSQYNDCILQVWGFPYQR